MNAGPTSTRIYEVLRARLRELGLPPGTRLDPARLADEMGASPTPVRDALHILAGEDIVIAGTSGGFNIPLFDQPTLIDLYGWNGDLLAVALRQQKTSLVSPGPVEQPVDQELPIADRVAHLFLRIANRSGNFEHSRFQARINDRLYATRLIEPQIIADLAIECRAMEKCYSSGDLNELRRLIARYTKRRQTAAGDIIHHLYRNTPK